MSLPRMLDGEQVNPAVLEWPHFTVQRTREAVLDLPSGMDFDGELELCRAQITSAVRYFTTTAA